MSRDLSRPTAQSRNEENIRAPAMSASVAASSASPEVSAEPVENRQVPRSAQGEAACKGDRADAILLARSAEWRRCQICKCKPLALVIARREEKDWVARFGRLPRTQQQLELDSKCDQKEIHISTPRRAATSSQQDWSEVKVTRPSWICFTLSGIEMGTGSLTSELSVQDICNQLLAEQCLSPDSYDIELISPLSNAPLAKESFLSAALCVESRVELLGIVRRKVLQPPPGPKPGLEDVCVNGVWFTRPRDGGASMYRSVK